MTAIENTMRMTAVMRTGTAGQVSREAHTHCSCIFFKKPSTAWVHCAGQLFNAKRAPHARLTPRALEHQTDLPQCWLHRKK